MRRKVLFTVFFSVFGIASIAQTYTPCSDCDTISGRHRNYYYCDWYDSCYEYYHPIFYTGMSLQQQYLNTPILCNGIIYFKELYTPRPMQIKGMMAMVDIYGGDFFLGFVDTIKLPEYLYLYQRGPNNSMILLDSTRWDTIKPHYMQLRVAADTDLFVYCYAYDTYFDSPITVDSFFYIGGSTNSNVPSSYYYHNCEYFPTQYRTVEYTNCYPSYRGLTLEYFNSHYYWIQREGVTGYYLPIVDNYEVTVLTDSITMGNAVGGGYFPQDHTVTIRAVPAHGFLFDHWNDGNTDNPRQIVVTQDTVFTAYFVDNITYTVSATVNTPAWGSVTGVGAYFDGDTVTLTAVPSLTGVMFDHWNDGSTDNPRLLTVTQDTSFTAFFRERGVYSLVAEPNNAAWGSVTGGGTYFECDTVTLTAVPANANCLFLGWDDSVAGNPRQVVVTCDSSFTALFREKALYTLVAEPNNPAWGSVTGGGTYYEGTYVVMQVYPANEYCSFLGWDDGNTYNPRAVTMSQDSSFTAIFSEIPLYTVDAGVNNPEWGDVMGGGQYREGQTATLRSFPATDGYFFVSWDDGSADNPRDVTVTQDTAFTAIFGTVDGVATPGGAERLRVTLSPNPASTTLTVTASRWDRYTVTLFDMYGRILEESPFTGTVCRLDIAAQPAGQYIVKVQSDSAVTTVSFVKK